VEAETIKTDVGQGNHYYLWMNKMRSVVKWWLFSPLESVQRLATSY